MRSYVLNPSHPTGEFRRTIRVECRPPRLAVFSKTSTVEMDAAEATFMAPEIKLGWIGVKGCEFPKPPKPEPPRLDPLEDPVSEQELSAWQRCVRDSLRRAVFYER